MKYCPTCETRYDEEILRFCMKDGTPLIEEGGPKFKEMPSESLEADDDPGEVTIIRKKGEVPIPPPAMDEAGELQPPEPEYRPKEEPAPRIVVPMQQPQQQFQPHSRVVTAPYQPPPKSNTFKVVVLTAMGTVLLLGAGALGFWLLTRGTPSNTNTNANNTNVNSAVNTNLGYDANFNFNAPGSFNTNSNVNANANVKTPTPTPKPSPSITPSPSPTPNDDNATPTPRPSPSVPTMMPSNRNTSPPPPRMMPANRPANRPANGT